MATFDGTMMDDMLPPPGGDNTGDDILWGGMGNDTLRGGGGDDRLEGGPGADSLDGGPGSDTADYAKSDARVHVDLSIPFDDDDDDPGPIYGGHAQGDTLQSIENIWGSSYSDELIGNHVANMLFGRAGNDVIDGGRGDDSIWGDAGADVLMGKRGDDMVFGGDDDDLLEGGDGDDILMGQAGDDVLEGDDGDDILEGGMGADDLDGGDNSAVGDTAAYTMSDEGVTVNLAYAQDNDPRTGPGVSGGDAAGDTLENIENVRGSMEDDKLTGDKDANRLYGNQGDDMLMGGMGNDMLRGGKGDDELEGGDGDDTLRGDKGDDTLTGDDGKDTFWLMKGDGDDTIVDFERDEGDIIRFGTPTQELTASEIRDILDTQDENRDGTYTYEWEDVSVTVDQPLMASDFGIEGSPTRLTEGDDVWPDDFPTATTRVQRGDNVIHGLDGDDEISGGRGDDSLFGNAGNDTLMGGDDDDTLNGGRGRDNLQGGDDKDMLLGGPGNDTLSGNRHNDTLTGGSGYDTFWFGEHDGRDTITDFSTGDRISLGGSPLDDDEIDEVLDSLSVGDDGYTYDWEGTSFTVNRPLTADDFEKAPPRYFQLNDDGDSWPRGGVDNSGDDDVRGGDGDDSINGGAGDDMLDGKGGDDTLIGGDGDDMLTGGAGSDVFKFDADDGDDMIADFQDSDMIMLGDESLSKTDAQGVIDSRMPVSDGAHKYTWGETTFTVQDDPLELRHLDYEEPSNLIDLGPGNDVWGVSDPTDATDYNGDDNYVAGGTGADSITGGAGDDMLDGNAGNDTLMGGAGDDTLTGGTGADSLSGGSDDDMLYADLADLTAPGGVAGGDDDDTLSFEMSEVAIEVAPTTAGNPTTAYTAPADIEKVVGSPHDDKLTLADLTPGGTLMGGDGADMLTGGTGADTLMGGAGDDTLDGGGGADMLTGGSGADTFVWGDDDTIKDFNPGEDKLDLRALTGVNTANDVTLEDKLGGVTITAATESIFLEGVSKEDLDASDFML